MMYYLREGERNKAGRIYSVCDKEGNPIFDVDKRPPFQIEECYAEALSSNLKLNDKVYSIGNDLIVSEKFSNILDNFQLEPEINSAPVTIQFKQNKIEGFKIFYRTEFSPDYSIERVEITKNGMPSFDYILDKGKVPNLDMFFFLRMPIVSERLKCALEEEGLTGASFEPVRFN